MTENVSMAYSGHMQACWLLLAAWTAPSRSDINVAIWAVGLVLQCALAFSLFRKDIARRYLGFTLIAIFYPVRSALLFALSGRIDADNYQTVHGALSFVEGPLQLFIAIELVRRLVREAGGWTMWRGLLVLLGLAAAFGLTAVTMSPLSVSLVTDRLQVFMGFVMLALFFALWSRSRRFNPVGIAGGFALFALLEIASLAGRTRAMMFRDTSGFLFWSYLSGIGYLAIVTLWIAMLVREG